MSKDDSIDEEVKAILASTGSDDSTESKPKKKLANDDYNEYETNTPESPDEDW